MFSTDGSYPAPRSRYGPTSHDRAEEAVAIAAALEKGPSLEGRMHARYAGVLAGRRGADASELPRRF